MTGVAALRRDADSLVLNENEKRLRDLIKDYSLKTGGNFLLASGATSNFYFEMKATTCLPEGANLISEMILEKLAEIEIDGVAGIELGAVPLVACVAMQSHTSERSLPGFLVRKEAKSRGSQELIEPHLVANMRIAVVDDVTTSGGSVLQAIQSVRAAGCIVDTAVTVVDRVRVRKPTLREKGVELIPLLSVNDFTI